MLRSLQRTACFKRPPARMSISMQSQTSAWKSVVRRQMQTHSEATAIKPSVETAKKIISRPPMPVRLALVGTTVILATPAFTIAGLFRLWTASKILPEAVKRMATLLIGGSTFTLFYKYIIPNIFDYSNLLLPFAVSNGIACMLWHGVGEAVLGVTTLATMTFVQFQGQHAFLQQSGFLNNLLKGVSKLPVWGAIIGVLAALTAPLLWPLSTRLCWTPELREFLLGGDDLTWLMDAYFSLALPVGVPVGFLSGLSLHHVLQPVVLGVEGTSWLTVSLPALAVVSLLCTLLYPLGPLLTGKRDMSTQELLWIRRLDPVTGEPFSVNLATKEISQTHQKALGAERKMGVIESFHWLRWCRQALVANVFWSTDDGNDSGSGTPALPAYGPNSQCSLKEAADMEAVYHLVDILVRHTYLEQQKDGGGAEREILRVEAMRGLQLEDLKGLFREAEKLCTLRKSLVKNTASSSEVTEKMESVSSAERDRAVMEKDVMEKLLLRRPSSRSDSSTERLFQDAVQVPCERRASSDVEAAVRGHRVMTLLAAPGGEGGGVLGILEQELEDKLGYTIRVLQTGEEEKEFIMEHNYENRVNTVKRGLLYLLPVLTMLALSNISRS